MAISKLATPYHFQDFGAVRWYAPRSQKVTHIVIHHAATTNFDVMPDIWATRVASAHYGIGQTGLIRAYVDENNAAWACGDGNQYTINIECTNTTLDPEWKVSDATINALIELIKEIQSRYGKLKIVGHRDIPNNYTLCPGPYLYARIPEIINRVNNEKTTVEQIKKRGNIMLLFRPENDATVYFLIGNEYTIVKSEKDLELIKIMMKQSGFDTHVHTNLKQIEYIKKVSTEKK